MTKHPRPACLQTAHVVATRWLGAVLGAAAGVALAMLVGQGRSAPWNRAVIFGRVVWTEMVVLCVTVGAFVGLVLAGRKVGAMGWCLFAGVAVGSCVGSACYTEPPLTVLEGQPFPLDGGYWGAWIGAPAGLLVGTAVELWQQYHRG